MKKAQNLYFGLFDHSHLPFKLPSVLKKSFYNI
jgi:hypothetical protein